MTSATAPIFSDPTYTQTTTQNTKKSDGGSINKDEFLHLLITQLKNQDPLNPMDDKDFVAQLATFSNLEQMTGINTSMTSLLRQQQQLNTTAAVGMIGLEVKAQDGTSGVVSSVVVDDKGTHLMIGDKEMDLANVKEIKYKTA